MGAFGKVFTEQIWHIMKKLSERRVLESSGFSNIMFNVTLYTGLDCGPDLDNIVSYIIWGL